MPMRNRFFYRKVLIFSAFILCFIHPSFGSYLQESFDYANQGTFESVWKPGSDSLILRSAPDRSGKAVYQDNLSRSNHYDLGINLQGSDSNPLVLEFLFYDSNPQDISSRHFVSLAAFSGEGWGKGNLENVIAMGVYNEPGNNRYHVRVHLGGSIVTPGWDQTSVTRRKGWRKMKIKIYRDEIHFFVDDNLAYIDTYTYPASGWNSIRIGYDLPSPYTTLQSYYDNIFIYHENSSGEDRRERAQQQPSILMREPLQQQNNIKSPIQWHESYQTAVRAAQENGQPMLIYFYQEDFPRCLELENVLFASEQFIQNSKGFVMLREDVSTNRQVASHYKIYRIPSIVVLDARGRVIDSFVFSIDAKELFETLQNTKE